MNLFVYQAGDSYIHKLGVGIKLLTLLAISLILMLLQNFTVLFALLIVTVVLYKIAGIRLALVITQLKPLLLLLIIVFVIQLFSLDLWLAILICLRIFVLMLLALLFTYTSKIMDLMDLLAKLLHPLERFGVSVSKVTLSIAITIRFIPLLIQIVTQIKQAQQARGIENSVILLIIPAIIKVLDMSENIANAIDARSFE